MRLHVPVSGDDERRRDDEKHHDRDDRSDEEDVADGATSGQRHLRDAERHESGNHQHRKKPGFLDDAASGRNLRGRLL